MKKEVKVYQFNNKYKFYNNLKKEECVLIIKLKLNFMIILVFLLK